MGSFSTFALRAMARGLGAGQRSGFGREARLFGETGMGVRSDLRDSTGRGSSLKPGGAK